MYTELLFNSLRDRLPGREPIPYICDFSRGGLNARFMRSHLNLAPRPQIYREYADGFHAVGLWQDGNLDTLVMV